MDIIICLYQIRLVTQWEEAVKLAQSSTEYTSCRFIYFLLGQEVRVRFFLFYFDIFSLEMINLLTLKL